MGQGIKSEVHEIREILIIAAKIDNKYINNTVSL